MAMDGDVVLGRKLFDGGDDALARHEQGAHELVGAQLGEVFFRRWLRR